jgi:pyruvyl transferase EpsI
MLFAAITGTPCIAFNNVSAKVEGANLWISDLDYIKIIDAEGLTKQVLEEMLAIERTKFNHKMLHEHFNKMANIIHELLSNSNN